MSRRTAASPRARRGRRRGVGRTGSTGIGPGGRRPRLTGARTKATAPGVPRRLPARGRGWRRDGAPGGVGLLRVASSGGDARRTATAPRRPVRELGLGLGFPCGGKESGGGSRAARASPLSTRGARSRGEVPRQRRSWRQCLHCRHRKKMLTGRAPCQCFNIFLLFIFPGKFRKLIEALNHF